MRIQRLFDMGPAELMFRGRQEVFKALERFSQPRAWKKSACRFDDAAIDDSMRKLLKRFGEGGSPPVAAELQLHLQGLMNQRFFAGLREDEHSVCMEQLLKSDPFFDRQQLIDRADAICRAEFSILGYGNLSFGRPVNWHLDPVSGQESPWVQRSRINPLAPDQVGDSKVVWELNRHQWLLDLGQAYRLTGDEKYATCFVERVNDWIERNPVAWGINWNSALEAAMRLISWCWALCFFRGSAALTPERFQLFSGCLQAHAGFVERNLSRYFSPNTHLTVEALALYYIGTLLPELQGARQWRVLGRALLLEQLPIQVPEGGIYFEQSTRYQYYTVEIYLHFAILAARNHDPLPALVNERLGEMLHFLLDVQRPDGTVPQIGDTDGGWLCPLSRRTVGDYRGLFSTAALLLNDPQLAVAAGSLTTESLFLLGAEAVDDWQALTSKPPSPRPLASSYSGACVIMRSGWDRDSHQLIFDTGPLGCHASGAHGHADLLAVQCSAFGENYLVDPGTGCYTAGSHWRQFFRSTQAHSTVLVDGMDQAATAGPFAWRERPDAQLLEYEMGSDRIFAAAQHDAYTRPNDPVTHRRRVWFLNARFWLIVDDLLGTLEHQVDLRFQYAPLPVREETDGWIRATGKESGLLLKTFSTSGLQTDLATGVLEPTRGWYSPNYGQQVPAPALTVSAHGTLPLRFATLLFPMRDRDESPPEARARTDAGLLTGLSIGESDVLVPDFGTCEHPQANQQRQVSS